MVELYGTPCVNPKQHPKDPEKYYPLMQVIGSGCGKELGDDTTYSQLVDK